MLDSRAHLAQNESGRLRSVRSKSPFFSGGSRCFREKHADERTWPSATMCWWWTEGQLQCSLFAGCPTFGRSCATPGFDLLAFLKRRLFVLFRVSLFGHELPNSGILLDFSPVLLF